MLHVLVLVRFMSCLSGLCAVCSGLPFFPFLSTSYIASVLCKYTVRCHGFKSKTPKSTCNLYVITYTHILVDKYDETMRTGIH